MFLESSQEGLTLLFSKDLMSITPSDFAFGSSRTESWKTRLLAADAETTHAKSALELTKRARQELGTQVRNSEALRADLGLQRDRLEAIGDRQALEITELRVLLDERDVRPRPIADRSRSSFSETAK